MADDDNIAIVRLSGSVDLHNVAEAHRALREAFDAHDDIALDVSDVAEADLTLVQLVESARITAAKHGKRIALTAPASGTLHETLSRGGFLARPASANFWLHQGD